VGTKLGKSQHDTSSNSTCGYARDAAFFRLCVKKECSQDLGLGINPTIVSRVTQPEPRYGLSVTMGTVGSTAQIDTGKSLISAEDIVFPRGLTVESRDPIKS
jgi:hypothetical protein